MVIAPTPRVPIPARFSVPDPLFIATEVVPIYIVWATAAPPIAVKKVDAANVDTELSALILGNVIADGLVNFTKFCPTVVASLIVEIVWVCPTRATVPVIDGRVRA